jgi:hypothetical protein
VWCVLDPYSGCWSRVSRCNGLVRICTMFQ